MYDWCIRPHGHTDTSTHLRRSVHTFVFYLCCARSAITGTSYQFQYSFVRHQTCLAQNVAPKQNKNGMEWMAGE